MLMVPVDLDWHIGSSGYKACIVDHIAWRW